MKSDCIMNYQDTSVQSLLVFALGGLALDRVFNKILPVKY